MTELFLKIVNMSITASILVGLVLILRLIFQKAPKWVNVLLWGLVAIRLVLPFGIESSFSLIPKTDWIVQESEVHFDTVAGNTPAVEVSDPGKDVIVAYTPVNPEIESQRGVNVSFMLSCIWICGMVLLLLYLAVSYFRIFLRIRTAKRFEDNIYLSSAIDSPFVFGVFRPRICLPENMDAVNMSYVVSHEQAHISRRDHWWKPIGFLLLTIHWFNPVLWLAYILLCRDIEMACDEKVVRDMGEVERADYSEALLECSVKRTIISACPLAFGEVGVKTRIKSVLNYKKPAFWIIVAAVLACAVAAVCFLTNPMDKTEISIDEHDWYFERVFITDLENNSIEEEYQRGLNPKTEKAEPVNAILVPDGEPMWYQFVTGDWDTDRIGLHFIPERTDSRNARYTVELYRDTGELYQGADAVMEPMTDGDGYVLTVYFTRDGYENQLIFTTEKQPGAVQGEKKLTIDDVLTLSQKQMALTWEDFAEYTYTDAGTWNFRCIYEIDDVFWLEITGGSMHGTPMQINLCAKADYGDGAEYVDIRRRYADEHIVENFIKEHQLKLLDSDQQATEVICTVDPPNDVWNLFRNDVMLFSGSGEKTLYTPYNFMGYTISDLQYYEITVENHANSPLQAMIYRTADDKKMEEISVGAGETAAFEVSADYIWYMEITDAKSDGKTVSFSGSIGLNKEKSATTDWRELAPAALEEAEKTGYMLQHTYARLKTVPDGNEIEIYFRTEDEKKYVGVSYIRENMLDHWRMRPENAVNVYDAETLELLESDVNDIRDSEAESAGNSLLNIPEPVEEYQSDIRIQAAKSIFGAETVYASGIDKLEKISTGTVGLSEEILLYRLDYWITKGINGLTGTPPEDIRRETVYFAMFHDWTTDTWTRLGELSEAELDVLYNTAEMLEKYGNKYTAAAAEMGHVYFDDMEEDDVNTSDSEERLFGMYLSYYVDLAWDAALPIAEAENMMIDREYYNYRHDYDGSTIWIQFYGRTESGWDDRYIDITIVREHDGSHKVDPDGCVIGLNSENIKNTMQIAVENGFMDGPKNTNQSSASSENASINATLGSTEGQLIFDNAVVGSAVPEKICEYRYVPVSVTDTMRESLFRAYFGDRADEVFCKDEQKDIWQLGETMSGDFYKYETVSGGQIFTLRYSVPMLNPLDDNRKGYGEVSGCTITAEEAVRLCDELLAGMTDPAQYRVDYIHYYGSNGQSPFFWICYKKILEGRTVNAYKDIFFFVDDNGVEEMHGALYDTEVTAEYSEVLSAEQAVEALRKQLDEVNWKEIGISEVSRISLEYITEREASGWGTWGNDLGSLTILPIWRMELGKTEEERILNRNRIIGVHAVTGELIQNLNGMGNYN